MRMRSKRYSRFVPHSHTHSHTIRSEHNEERPDNRELSDLSTGYARLWGTYLRVTTSSAVGLNPLDLHALSTPPAFTLSYDQTLTID